MHRAHPMLRLMSGSIGEVRPLRDSPGDDEELLRLNVLLLTDGEALAREVERVCHERRHVLNRIDRLSEVGDHLSASLVNGLLLDCGQFASSGAPAAAAVCAVYPELNAVLIAREPVRRSEGGFAVVDGWGAGERFLDALELASIGIPASVPKQLPGEGRPGARHASS